MINVAYNEILVYSTDGKKQFPASNVLNYDIHPWHTVDLKTLKHFKEKYGIEYPYTLQLNDPKELREDLNKLNSQDFSFMVDSHRREIFNMCTVDEVYENGMYFVYPIILYSYDLFTNYDTMDFPDKVVESVLKKKCKICFYQPTEGFFGFRDEDLIWVYNLSKKYGFEKDGITVITANLKSPETKDELIKNNIIEDNFTIHPYSYFQHNLWFTNCMITNDTCVEKMRFKFNECLEFNKQQKKIHHFLSFNRITKTHRLVIFAELMCNELLKNKSITTLGASHLENKDQFYIMILNNISETYKHSKVKLLNFYNEYDATKHYTYDCDDLENNKADVLNMSAHKSSFVNIITESLIDTKSVFFSEKTFKPMSCAQPFIIVGNPHSLKKLKELGFMTFDKWWDESYDNETNFTSRLDKIVYVLEEIASWDLEKCYQITQEMEEVLINNFNVMVSNKEVVKLIQQLESKPIRLI